MAPRATVVIPTFDNGVSIERSIDSVLAQTVDDFELFVVGDGAVEAARRVVIARARRDSRIRFFDNPKGPRHGEVHRHAALEEASGEIVAYLGDDDLWLPDHVKQLSHLLSGADFAHTTALWVGPGDSLGIALVDLDDPADLAMEREASNRIPLSVAGHTLTAYRRLPHGWRTTPIGLPTDWWMWRQFLDQPGVRVASGSALTVLRFPSPVWQHAPSAAKIETIERWWTLSLDAEWVRDELPRLRAGATADSLRRTHRQWAELRMSYDRMTGTLRWRILHVLLRPFRPAGAAPTGRTGPKTTVRSRLAAKVGRR